MASINGRPVSIPNLRRHECVYQASHSIRGDTHKASSPETSLLLGLFTETESDFQKICDAYGMDRDLFSNEKGATWENKKQGERQTWNNTIIPEALEWVDGLNDVFGTGNESWMLVANFVDIPVLQENIAEKGQAIKQITDSLSVMLADRVITPEEYQKELNKLGFELTELPKEVQP